MKKVKKLTEKHKDNIRQALIGRKNGPHSEKTKKKIGDTRRGKSYEEFIGKKKAKEMRKKRSEDIIKAFARGDKIGFQKGHKCFGTKESYERGGNTLRRTMLLKFANPEYIKEQNEIEKARWKDPIYMEKQMIKVRKMLATGTKTWTNLKAGYLARHARVNRKRGKPVYCFHCGVSSGYMEWSSLDHSYNLDIYHETWVGSCKACHKNFDRIMLKFNVIKSLVGSEYNHRLVKMKTIYI